MHLDNIALLGGVDDCRLTPVYDPAPMRAWPRHNLISAIPFDPSDYADRGEFFIHLGESFGLPKNRISDCIEQTLEATKSYIDQVMALENVPIQLRQQLAEISRIERQNLQKH
jgi:serine/threonine-protein kinase HipA